MKTFVALLRGINVGGHQKIPMADLRQLLEQAGYRDVKTVLASGNVVFGSDKTVKERDIEQLIHQHFGFDVPVQVIPYARLKKLIQAKPFKGQAQRKEIKWYVTFLGGSKAPKPQLEDSGAIVVGLKEGALLTVFDTSKRSSVDLMAALEKQYGKQVTTRTWQTVEKILACR